jgi:DNA-binding MarR family transcriptional regulator
MSSKDHYFEALENWANTYLYRSLSGYFDYLKTTGVSMQQAYALTYIYHNGASKISNICEHMMVTAAAASQMVDRLEKLNLVVRIADPEDRRVRNVALTEEGEDFARSSIEARKRWITQIPTGLSDEQYDHIANALGQLTQIYKNYPK